MKIFWSWQSDTPGKTGRHFVRETLEEAITELKQAPSVEEPPDQARLEDLHLDHDRKGVPGSPDLARLIFDKIDASTVFIADVTPVGHTPDGKKKLINPNVAIEYGHAHNSLGDTSILLVQNQHYGTRDDLPFDLRHKAGPIQFTLAPDASKEQIAAEKTKLKSQFIVALREYLTATAPVTSKFEETPPVGSPAVFFEPMEVLTITDPGMEEETHYTFAEPRAFYLRLMPTTATPPLKQTKVMEIAQQKRPDVLSTQPFSGSLNRNRFGVIALETSGTNTTPYSLTQIMPRGEVWGVSRNFFRPFNNEIVIPVTSLENIYRRVLTNYCELLRSGLGIAPPFTVELGATGLEGTYVGTGHPRMDGPIYENELKVRLVLNDCTKEAINGAVKEFIDALLDHAGVTRE